MNIEDTFTGLKYERTIEEKRAMRANRKKTEGNDELYNEVMKEIAKDNNFIINPTISEMEEWATPVTFDEYNTIPFPVEVFPPTIRNMIKAVSTHTQTPTDLASMVCFGVLSTASNKKFVIEPKPDWIETLNTYTATFLPSSSRKSAVYKTMTKSIYSYASELRNEMESQILKRKLKRSAFEKRIDKLQNDYAKTNDSSLLEEIEKISEELLKHPELTKPRIVLDNATSEEVAVALKENNEKVSIMSAEGDLFMKFISPSEQGKHDVYLKGYSGDTLQVDRVSRAGENLEEPLLTICIAAQPTVIKNIPPYLHERGIPARFLFSIPKDNLGFRDAFPPSVPIEVDREYNNLIRKLLVFSPKEKRFLRLSEDATSALKRLINDIEKEFRENGLFEGNLKYWGGKLVGQLLRIAGLLHITHHAELSELNDIPTEVNLEIMEKALLLKDYFISHAQKVFGVMKQNEILNDATYLLEKILNEKRLEIEKQTIHQKSKKKIQGKHRFTRAYDLLEYHSYIKQIQGGKYGNKGMIKVNPLLFDKSSLGS